MNALHTIYRVLNKKAEQKTLPFHLIIDADYLFLSFLLNSASLTSPDSRSSMVVGSGTGFGTL